MSFGWEGKKVRLVPLDRQKHFENCVRWQNDPQVTRWMLHGDFPLTRVAEEDFFNRVCRQSDQEVIFAVETLDEQEEHIGVCGLTSVDYRHGTAEVGIVIGRQQLWNHGYGTDAVAVLTRYGFDVLGLRLLLAGALEENAASRRVLQKNGYGEVGRIPERWWKRGGYRDEILLALRRSDWQP